MNNWYVYILKSKKMNKFYKGLTQNIERRVIEHNSSSSSSHTDKTLGPFDLMWYCVFHSKERAIEFEKYLKSGSGRAFTNKHLA